MFKCMYMISSICSCMPNVYTRLKRTPVCIHFYMVYIYTYISKYVYICVYADSSNCSSPCRIYRGSHGISYI